MKIMARILTKKKPLISPFNEAASEMIVGQETLHAQQKKMAAAFGYQLIDIYEDDVLPENTNFAFAENVFFNEAAIELLLQKEKTEERILQMTIQKGTPLFNCMAPLSGHFSSENSDHDLPIALFAGALSKKYLHQEKTSWHVFSAEENNPQRQKYNVFSVCLDAKEADKIRVPPYGPSPHLLYLPAQKAVAATLSHWLHVLHVNFAELFAQRSLLGAIHGKNTFRGKVNVHPTAFVENSILEDGVEVEAGASVMNSWIGANVKVADHAVLNRCVIGADCHTLIDTHLRRVVAFSGSTLSNLGTEDLLLGREIFITTAAVFFGGLPQKTVIIDGEDTLRPCLGGVVGHRATLGARSLFEAGAFVPSNLTVVGRPDDAIARFSKKGLESAHAILGNPCEDA